MGNPNRYHKIVALTTAQPGACAIFVDEDTLETLEIPVIVWAAVEWYDLKGGFLNSEIIGMSSLTESLALVTNDPWSDNFVCYLFADDDVDRDLVEPVRERMRLRKLAAPESEENNPYTVRCLTCGFISDADDITEAKRIMSTHYNETGRLHQMEMVRSFT